MAEEEEEGLVRIRQGALFYPYLQHRARKRSAGREAMSDIIEFKVLQLLGSVEFIE
jgi:hypothetical protein